MLSSVSFGSTTRSSQLRSSASPTSSSPTSIAFAGLDDELRDARRVLSQGQEEDLRYALDRVLNKVEELSSLLKTAIKTQTELETQLNLAKSNLQLVISNNEMLEEALKRETPCNAKDVGWRRWSAREVQNHNTERKSEERPRSLDYGPLNASGTPTVPSSAAVVLVNGIKPPSSTDSSPRPATPVASQESRFFKFRFSSGGSDADTSVLATAYPWTGTPSPALTPHPSHLTSPSLSSLVPNAREKEMEELQEQLEHERQAHKAADAAKTALEAELESLSQALFEEVDASSLIDSVCLNTPQANKMVATERMRRAETEEELTQARMEKDALRQALQLIEGENGRLRSANASPDMPLGRIDQSDTPSVALPLRASPEPPSSRPSSRSPTCKVTHPIAPSYEMPGHFAGFQLEPAPKPSLAGTHRKTASMEKLGIADLSIKDSLPVIAAAPSVPLMPDEPSPWGDVAS
ncbi:hypothetical protein J3R83DRAFT_3673 [Lanmaoa asiatica]|nr:hypothetical protein J3R83DRAFT_3673 [Lanmaoa asiatica]